MWDHYGCTKTVTELLARYNIEPIVIIRDPRDIVLSLLDYIHRKKHILKTELLKRKDRESQIICLIKGLYKENMFIDTTLLEQNFGFYGDKKILSQYVGFYNIGETVRRYYGWLKYKKACVLRFEDLMDVREYIQVEQMRKINDHLGIGMRDEELLQVLRMFIGAKTATMNKGSREKRWIYKFTPRIVEQFKEIAGKELIDFGYEKDDNWGLD